MPRNLKLVARFADTAAILVFLVVAIALLSRGNAGSALFGIAVAALFGFNLYLVEKSARLLSEEEWLKGEIRKVHLRRKLQRLASEDEAMTDAAPEHDDERKARVRD